MNLTKSELVTGETTALALGTSAHEIRDPAVTESREWAKPQHFLNQISMGMSDCTNRLDRRLESIEDELIKVNAELRSAEEI